MGHPAVVVSYSRVRFADLDVEAFDLSDWRVESGMRKNSAASVWFQLQRSRRSATMPRSIFFHDLEE